MHFKLPTDLHLAGRYASLEPMQAKHGPALGDAAADGELWNLEFTGVPSRDSVDAYIKDALEQHRLGQQQPFIVRRISDQQLVGSTRFYDISPLNRNLAIGYTWYCKSAQRTAINTECKLMLLTYAFEQLGCISVAFHTDHKNVISQAAIARLGASKDGVLRNHKILPNGRIRHTWCFSIIDSQWPDSKSKLMARLLRNEAT